MTTTMGVKLDEATRDRLKALGAARQRSPHWLMREAIREYLERAERIEHRNVNPRWGSGLGIQPWAPAPNEQRQNQRPPRSFTEMRPPPNGFHFTAFTADRNARTRSI